MTVQEFCDLGRWDVIQRLGVTWQIQNFSTGCVALKCIYQDPPYLCYVMYEQPMWIKWIEQATEEAHEGIPGYAQ
jgi:hypothetical protein